MLTIQMRWVWLLLENEKSGPENGSLNLVSNELRGGAGPTSIPTQSRLVNNSSPRKREWCEAFFVPASLNQQSLFPSPDGTKVSLRRRQLFSWCSRVRHRFRPMTN